MVHSFFVVMLSFASPAVRYFLICIGSPATPAGAGAAPMIDRAPADNVEGARGIGAPNSEEGCCACWEM